MSLVLLLTIVALSVPSYAYKNHQDDSALSADASPWARYPWLTPIKKSILFHSNNVGGRPRYTSLVRRNFLRFGKRSGPPTFQPEHNFPGTQKVLQEVVESNEVPVYLEDQLDNYLKAITGNQLDMGEPSLPIKRTRNFIRFGKRDGAGLKERPDSPFGDPEDEEVDITAERMEKRPKMEFLRFGRSPSYLPAGGCGAGAPCSKRAGLLRNVKKFQKYLRFGR